MGSKLSIVILALITTTVGCGEKPRRQLGQRTFINENREAAKKFESEKDLSPEARMAYEAEKAAPLIVKGEVKNPVPAYKMPQKFYERLEKTQPQLAVKSSTQFQITDQHLHISTKTNRMTFSGTLKIPGKQDEAIELACTFNQSHVPWSCDQMYPTNAKVAEERRLQATVNCLDTFRCEQVGVELFVVINGKTESQLFQNGKFVARKAVSGDIEEDVPPVKPVGQDEYIPPVKTVPGKPTTKKEDVPPIEQLPQKPRNYQPQVEDPSKDIKVYEKPAAPQPETQQISPPAEVKPQEQSEFGPELSEEELEQLMDDPNQAIEFSAPMPMPAPAKGKYSIPGIETLRPNTGDNVKSQAIGSHNRGILQNGATLHSGTGMLCRHRANRNYGTDLTIQMLTEATADVDAKFPGHSPIVVANIAKQGGGKLCNPSGCHASHQTGLDVDVVFPSTKKVSDMWSLCGPNQAHCAPGNHISDNFDTARFWHFVKTLNCAKGQPVIAMFIDKEIKRYMCKWVRQNTNEDLTDPDSCGYRTLQAMKHARGHYNHVHVRFKCPGNRDCRDATVSLGRGTGC